MISIEDLLNKVEDFKALSQQKQVELVSYFYCIINDKTEFSSSEIKSFFTQEHLKPPSNISREISNLLQGKNSVLLRKGQGYVFHRDKWKQLNEQFLNNKHAREVSNNLRSLLPKIASQEQKSFLDEAIICFEVKCYRASIIMTWLLTIDILYEHVLKGRLSNFNLAVQTHGQYKKLSFAKKEDFSDLKESTFLELLRVGKIISGDQFKILKDKLDFRNTSAHPNMIVIKETKAVSFIEDLIENIIIKFQR